MSINFNPPKKDRAFYRFCTHILPAIDIKQQIAPNERGRVLLCNHAREFAPLAFIKGYKRPFKMWATANLCERSRVPNHIMYSFFPNAGAVGRLLLRPLSYAVAPIFPAIMARLDVIPTYQNRKAMQTFGQTVDALLAGYDIVIFPENEVESRYPEVNCLNGGFLRLAEMYYDECGLPLQYVPCYACKALKTVVVGGAISFDHSKPIRKQFVPTKENVMAEIAQLARSLPEHKLAPFGDKVRDPERIKKYESKDKYSLRE
ncbi:MAG: hypothetical protein R3Y23_01300 [Bacillota bacterium]